MVLQVDIKLVIGLPFSEILKTEDKETVSAVILGSHGKSNVKEMLLGSVSEKVIRNSKTPVIVIKRSYWGQSSIFRSSDYKKETVL